MMIITDLEFGLKGSTFAKSLLGVLFRELRIYP